jgi:hypothetical protein
VLPKRWKVDINSTVSAGMMLGGIILPDGALRRRAWFAPLQALRFSFSRPYRRTHDDELAMRSFYAENDLISVRDSLSVEHWQRPRDAPGVACRQRFRSLSRTALSCCILGAQSMEN